MDNDWPEERRIVVQAVNGGRAIRSVDWMDNEWQRHHLVSSWMVATLLRCSGQFPELGLETNQLIQLSLLPTDRSSSLPSNRLNFVGPLTFQVLMTITLLTTLEKEENCCNLRTFLSRHFNRASRGLTENGLKERHYIYP